MKEYILMQGETAEALMQQVNLKLSDQWELQGGIAVFHGTVESYDNCASQNKTMFYQAMSRKKQG